MDFDEMRTTIERSSEKKKEVDLIIDRLERRIRDLESEVRRLERENANA